MFSQLDGLFSSFARASSSSFEALGGISTKCQSRACADLVANLLSGIWGPFDKKSAAVAFWGCCPGVFSASFPPFWGADGKSDDSGMTGIL
jgi:hypothetical protein